MRMGKKFPSKPTIATLLFISLTVYLFTSLILPSSDSRNLNSSFNSNPYPQVRIFLYDLPRKFTLGVVESYHAARNNKNNNGVSGRDKYPGHQHTAEWYLFSDLTNPTRPADSAVVRVFDPLEADLFFVPFFSSLSLVVNPVNGVAQDGFVYIDEEMQDELVEFLEGSPYWKRNFGRDHVFVCQDPNALYKVIDQIKNGILIVSDFGRLRGDQGSYVKDVVVPYSHRINSYKGEIGVEGRRNLLFFMGNRYRKEGGKIRDTLFNLLEGEGDVVIKHGTQSRESRRAATQGMHSSKFCLHPAGDTPSACRLFDAIVSLCIPVVVSDYIELPFENVVDYTKIAIFVSTDAAVETGYLLSALRGINTEKILEYHKEVQKVKHYFEYEAPTGTVPEIWRQVSSKLSVVKFMINRDKRLVRSSSPSDFDCSCLCSNRTLLATSTL